MKTGDEQEPSRYKPRFQPFPAVQRAIGHVSLPALSHTGNQKTLFDIYKTKIATHTLDNDTYEDLYTGWILLPLVAFFTCPIVWAGMKFGFWLNDKGWKVAAVFFGSGSWLLWGAVIFAILNILYKQARQIKNREAMQLQEDKSSDVLEKIKYGYQPDPYFVFLRPFSAENAECSWYDPSNLHSADLINATTIDDELTQVLQVVGPTLCLGNPTEGIKIGATRIPSTDESWRQDIHQLLEHCTGVFLFPWYSESTMEEVVKIFQSPELIAKTVFFMPPARCMMMTEVHWRETLEKLAKKHIELPSYKSCGLIFNAHGNYFGLVDNISNREDFQRKLLSLWRV